MSRYGLSDTILREVEIRVNTQGTAAAAELRQAVQGVEAELMRLARTTPANQKEARELAAAWGRLVHEGEGLQRVLVAVENRLAGVANLSVRDLKRQEAAARAVLEISRGIEDFAVAGLRGALNNIPMLMMSIGQSAGWSATRISNLTGVVSLLATSAYLLIENWRPVRAFFQDLGDALADPTTWLEKLGNAGAAAIDGLSRAFSRLEENTVTDPVDRLQSQLKQAQKEVHGLGEQTRLTAEEMERYTYGKKRVDELALAYKEAKAAQDLLKKPGEASEGSAEAFRKWVGRHGGGVIQQAILNILEDYSPGGGEVSIPELGLSGPQADVASRLFGMASTAEDPLSYDAFYWIRDRIRGGAPVREDVARSMEALSPDNIERENEEREKRAEREKADHEREQRAREHAQAILQRERGRILGYLAHVDESTGRDQAMMNAAAGDEVEAAMDAARVPDELREDVRGAMLDDLARQYRARRAADGTVGIRAAAADRDTVAAFRRKLDLEARRVHARARARGLSEDAANAEVEAYIRGEVAPVAGEAEGRNVAAALAVEARDQFRSFLGGRQDVAQAAGEFVDETDATERKRKTDLEREREHEAERAQQDQKKAEREQAARIRRVTAAFEGEVDDPIEVALAENRLRNERLASMSPQERRAAVWQMRTEASLWRRQRALQRSTLRGRDRDRFDQITELTAPLEAPVSDERMQEILAERMADQLVRSGARNDQGETIGRDDAQAAAASIVARAASQVSQDVTGALMGNVSTQEALANVVMQNRAEMSQVRARQDRLARALEGLSMRPTHAPRGE